MASSLARIGLSSAAMGFVAGALAWLLGGYSAWFSGTAAILMGLVEYVAASLALRTPEPWAVWGMVMNRSRAR